MVKLLTAESVSPGHPDKVMDYIVDSILDEILMNDPNARVAIDGVFKDKYLTLGGEITTTAKVNYEEVIKRSLLELGYNDLSENVDITLHLFEQSPDIALGTNDGVGGAGDQGTITGYACNDNSRMIPLEKAIADEIMRVLYFDARVNYSFIKPDMKSQVTIEYSDEGVRVHTVVVACQHEEGVDKETFNAVITDAIKAALLHFNMTLGDAKVIINGTGEFTIGGPEADSGEVGRKIVVDAYGVSVPVGGGTYCVDGDTEYLSKDGWRKIKDYSGEDVAQWDNWKIQFVQPYAYIDQPADKMYRLYSPNGMDMVMSENHDIVYVSTKGNINKKRLKDLITDDMKFMNGFHGDIPITYTFDGFDGVNLSDDEIRLQVAFCADGIIVDDIRGTINIKKDRKKQRLLDLFNKLNIQYSSYDHGEGYTRYTFIPPILSKSLKDCLCKANSEQLKIIASELPLWDGDASSCYRTTIKEDADFAQYVFMSQGNYAFIAVDDRVGEPYGEDGQYIRKSICYVVYPEKRSTHALRNGHLNIEEFTTDRMYCFTVPSGMLLLRRNNRVFVTGNCGKDSSKVDRSAAYYARYIAKNIVSAGLADKCLITVSYCIGLPKPISVDYNFFGTEHYDESEIIKAVESITDYSPKGIIDKLRLKSPIYSTAGLISHYGLYSKLGLDFSTYINIPWESTDLVEYFQDYFHNYNQEEEN